MAFIVFFIWSVPSPEIVEYVKKRGYDDIRYVNLRDKEWRQRLSEVPSGSHLWVEPVGDYVFIEILLRDQKKGWVFPFTTFQILPKKVERRADTYYIMSDEIRWWSGKDLRDICEHQKIKSHCKECGGSQICEHQKRRSTCKECGGGQICEHQKRRSTCKECGGSQICEHQRVRSQCKECGGSQICEHQKRRSECKECGGSQICEHQRVRCECKECGGASICEHQKIRYSCHLCDIKKHPHRWCKLCEHVSVTRSQYRFYCTSCFAHLNPDTPLGRRVKTKENFLHQWLTTTYPDTNFIRDKKIAGGCSRRRPDWFLDCGFYVLIIENDENAHRQGDYSCENKRIVEIFQDCGNRPMIMIRFNPDTYTLKGQKQPSCFRIQGEEVTCDLKKWNDRVSHLKTYIDWAIALKEVPDKEITTIPLFYNDEDEEPEPGPEDDDDEEET